MTVAFVTGARAAAGMGLETAEARLLGALRAKGSLDVRVVGGRGAQAYASRIGASWYPARPGRSSRRAWRNADLVHLAGLSLPPPEHGRFVATIHDLSPLHFPDEGLLPLWTAEIAERAAQLICPSEFTASELVARLGVERERITVVPNGPGHDASEAPSLTADELAELGLRAPLVLRLGGYTGRKNVSLLLDAWPEIRQATGASLALVGPPQAMRAERLAAAPSLVGVSVLDYVPAELVPRLLASAHVLVSTSRYEGFGLPPLEAMTAGVPVVALRTPFHEEVCGDAALLVEDDSEALAAAVVRVADDDELRERLGAAGRDRAPRFSWARSAELLLDVYRDVGTSP